MENEVITSVGSRGRNVKGIVRWGKNRWPGMEPGYRVKDGLVRQRYLEG